MAKILVRLLNRPGLRRAGNACSWAVRRPNWKTPSTVLNIGSLSSSFTQPGGSPHRAGRLKSFGENASLVDSAKFKAWMAQLRTTC